MIRRILHDDRGGYSVPLYAAPETGLLAESFGWGTVCNESANLAQSILYDFLIFEYSQRGKRSPIFIKLAQANFLAFMMDVIVELPPEDGFILPYEDVRDWANERSLIKEEYRC